MKSHLLLPLIACLLLQPLFAQKVDVGTALKVAENFYAQQHKQKSAGKLQLYVAQTNGNHLQKSAENAVSYYIFNEEGRGFVMVSGDYRLNPVLAYSTSGSFDTTDMPDNLRWWLQNYQDEMAYGLSLSTATEAHPLWEVFAGNQGMNILSTKVVEPLVKTRWNQRNPYNLMCPYDNEYGGLSVTGCVATAMAQMLYFWQYPKRGIGLYRYDHRLGRLSANFGATEYDWKNMNCTYDYNSSNVSNEAVATLMYHCGVSVGMDYSGKASGAQVYWHNLLSKYYGRLDARTAFIRYFDYDTAYGYYRDEYYDTNDASTLSSWTNLLKGELNAGRPILYAGHNSEAGHAFVCDGYDANGLFHINWGWGGTSDGYFAITALNPTSQGTGGSDGGFNYNQQAIFLRPGYELYDLRIHSPLNISKKNVDYGSAFSVSVKVTNSGDSTYDGNLTIGIYRTNGTLVGMMDPVRNRRILHGACDSLLFTTAGMPELNDGKYIAKVLYSRNNRWKLVGDGKDSNAIWFTVGTGNNFYLDLANELSVSQTTVEFDYTIYFEDSVANTGDKSFNGQLGVAIYNLYDELQFIDGTGVQQLNAGSFRPMTFTVNIPPTMESGYYYGRIVYSVDNGSHWIPIDGIRHTNSIFFYVVAEASLGLQSGLSVDQDTVPYYCPFSIMAEIRNSGKGNFDGEFSMRISDSEGKFIFAINLNEIIYGYYSKIITFHSSGRKELQPGKTYSAVLYYHQKNDTVWKKLKDYEYLFNKDKTCINYVDFVIGEESTYKLSLSSDLAMNPRTIVPGQDFSIGAAIANSGDMEYDNVMTVGIFDANDNHKIGEAGKRKVSIGYFNRDSIVFSIKSVKGLVPGTYYAVIYHKDIEDAWQELDGGNYTNKLVFTVSDNVSVSEAGMQECLPYPNPTKDRVYLDLQGRQTEISLIAPDGRLLLRQKSAEEQYMLDMSGYAAGIYMLIAKDDRNVRTFRIEKQ